MELDKYIPGQSIDCVIVGFDRQELRILVLKWKGVDMWALPGGFIRKEEDMDKAATRILKERSGIDLPFLQQFRTFGETDRRDQATLNLHRELLEMNEQVEQWFNQRFISTGYLSLVDVNQCRPQPDDISDAVEWRSIEDLPNLIFDHNRIVTTALKYIRNQINYLPIGLTLLPEKFTMKQLQHLYESVLQKKLDRGNFQRKMLKLGIFIRLEKQIQGGAHRAPYLYSFDKKKYDQLLLSGFGLVS